MSVRGLKKLIDRENIKKLFESKNMDSSTLEDLISFYSLSSKIDKDHIDLLFTNDDFQKKISLLSNNREYTNSKIDKTENDSELSLEYMGLCNIDWLRYFVVFAESINTYDASEKLHITHQALSKALGGIEKHFKIKLIERSKNYKGLTLAGQELLEKSRVIIQQLYSIEKYFNDLRLSNLKGFLKIGISKCYNKDIFSDILIKFNKNNPDVYPQIYSMTSDEIETAISIGEIEIGLTKKIPKRQETEYILLSKTPYVIVGKPQEKKHWRDFSYIISKSYNTSNNYFDAWQDDKFERKIIAELDSIDLLLELCEKGFGVAFLPELLVKEKLNNGKLVIVADNPLDKNLSLFTIWNKNIHLSEIAKSFIKEVLPE